MPEINGAAGKASPLRQRNKIGGNHQSGAAFIICRGLGADTMRPHISNRLGPQRHDLPHGLPHFQIHPAAVGDGQKNQAKKGAQAGKMNNRWHKRN